MVNHHHYLQHEGKRMPYKVNKTDEEWRQLLSAEQYEVMRHKGTEPPFTGPSSQERTDPTAQKGGTSTDNPTPKRL